MRIRIVSCPAFAGQTIPFDIYFGMWYVCNAYLENIKYSYICDAQDGGCTA